MKTNRCRTGNFAFSLADHFASCRTFLITFCGAVLVGILIGCFSFAKFNKVFVFSSFSFLDANLFFSKVNFFSYACKNIFKFVFLCLLIFLFSLNVYTFPLNIFTNCYMGYLVGANMTLMIMILGLTGTISMIIIYLPLSLCACFLVINFACICERNCFDNHKYGKFSCKGKGLFPNAILLALVVLVLIFVILLLEGLLLPTSVKNILLKI